MLKQHPPKCMDRIELTDLNPLGEYREQYVTEKGQLTTFDDQQLHWHFWSEEGAARGTVVIHHGYGDHSGRFQHVAAALVRAGYNVLLFDARGHGRSSGKQGHVEQYGDYVNDFDRFVQKAQHLDPEVPIFALGHSNGGLVVLHYMLSNKGTVQGFIASNPMCKFAVEIATWKSALGQILSSVWPTFTLPSDLDPDDLTHNREVVEAYNRDEYTHEIATARWYTQALKAQNEIRERAGEITAPALWLIGGDDRVCNPDASEECFHRLGSPDTELEVYPALYHELLNEDNWKTIISRIVDWLDRH